MCGISTYVSYRRAI